MAQNADQPCPACVTDGASVWDDETWVLTHSAPDLVLTLREHADLGHLDDDVAAQFGRLTSRVVRIAEGRARIQDGAHLQLRVESAGVPDLHAVATKLANWGGEARA